jgi:hypothetical protein
LFAISHPDAVIEEVLAQAAQAVGLRIDTPDLLAGVMTWPVPREVVENDEDERRTYLAWREDSMASAQRLWGDRSRCIVEHVDEPKLHFHTG